MKRLILFVLILTIFLTSCSENNTQVDLSDKTTGTTETMEIEIEEGKWENQTIKTSPIEISEGSSTLSELKLGNYPTNINKGGEVVANDTYIFFIKEKSIFRAKKDGSDFKKIYEEKNLASEIHDNSLSSLNIYNNHLYFIENMGQTSSNNYNDYIIKINLDGDDRSVVFEASNYTYFNQPIFSIIEFNMFNNKIYCTVNMRLIDLEYNPMPCIISINLDEGERCSTEINRNSNLFWDNNLKYVGKSLVETEEPVWPKYYVPTNEVIIQTIHDDHSIIKENLDLSFCVKNDSILGVELLSGNILYYRIVNKIVNETDGSYSYTVEGIYSYDMNTKQRKKLFNCNVNLNPYNDYLYFSYPNDNDYLYAIKTDGTNLTKLCDISTEKIYIADDLIVFIGKDGEFYKIKPDGTELLKLT